MGFVFNNNLTVSNTGQYKKIFLLLGYWVDVKSLYF